MSFLSNDIIRHEDNVTACRQDIFQEMMLNQKSTKNVKYCEESEIQIPSFPHKLKKHISQKNWSMYIYFLFLEIVTHCCDGRDAMEATEATLQSETVSQSRCLLCPFFAISSQNDRFPLFAGIPQIWSRLSVKSQVDPFYPKGWKNGNLRQHRLLRNNSSHKSTFAFDSDAMF